MIFELICYISAARGSYVQLAACSNHLWYMYFFVVVILSIVNTYVWLCIAV